MKFFLPSEIENQRRQNFLQEEVYMCQHVSSQILKPTKIQALELLNFV